jgi:predicted DNA-binding transcriptional regulator AlpA
MKKSFGHPRAKKAIADDILLLPRDLHALGINYHMNHLRRLWQRGDFPKPVHLSARKIAWRKIYILRWIASKSGGTP